MIQECEVRKMRDRVYVYEKHGPISDESWEKVRENWMKPENVRWLQQQPQNKLHYVCH